MVFLWEGGKNMKDRCIALYMKMLAVMTGLKRSFSSERGGAGIIAAVILIVLVVALGIAFRGKIVELWNNLWGGVSTEGLNAPIPT
jgi:hypothetical protein